LVTSGKRLPVVEREIGNHSGHNLAATGPTVIGDGIEQIDGKGGKP
jgi:hypothetical protein